MRTVSREAWNLPFPCPRRTDRPRLNIFLQNCLPLLTASLQIARLLYLNALRALGQEGVNVYHETTLRWVDAVTFRATEAYMS